MWTIAQEQGWNLEKLSGWLSTGPAELVGLESRKGKIAVGYDADLCIWDPDEMWTVDAKQLHHRHKVTPYDGEKLRGSVKQTLIDGKLVTPSS